MQQVSSITCNNNGAFVMKFKVKWDGGESGWTDNYPIDQSKTIDLSTLNIPPGSEVWPEVHAEAGTSKNCGDHVQYQPGDNNATYRISGTTFDIHCSLEGS